MPGRALDVGCGSGRDAVYLGKRGWRVTAVDSVDKALASAQRRQPKRASRCSGSKATSRRWIGSASNRATTSFTTSDASTVHPTRGAEAPPPA